MPERYGIERRKPYPNVETRCHGAYPLDDLPQKTRAILKTAAILPITSMRAEELMAEIAVAMLDIDEVKAELPSERGGAQSFGEFRTKSIEKGIN